MRWLAGMALMAMGAAAIGDDAPSVAITSGDLAVTVATNAAEGERREGYNGIHVRLGDRESPFVPLYAGWNLEHYFDKRAPHEDGAIFFEPRRHPMTVTKLSDTAAELHLPPTPHFGVESWTRFEAKEGKYVDFTFRAIPHKPMHGGFLGVFWASYMAGPDNKSLYFLGPDGTLDAPKWLQFSTQQHDRDSSVPWANESAGIEFETGGRSSLWLHLSPLRFGEPFYYGRIGDLVLIYLFERDAVVRFAHSPSGGGRTPDGTDSNPAWDFQWFVPDAKTDAEYQFRGRLVVKPWAGRDDVLAEAKAYYGE